MKLVIIQQVAISVIRKAAVTHRLAKTAALVKLHQFQDDDSQQVFIDTTTGNWLPGQGGLKVLPLHSHHGESTALVKWPAGERFVSHVHPGGEEIYVISGEFIDEYGHYPAGTWIRSPHMSRHHPYVEQETLIFVKVGHL